VSVGDQQVWERSYGEWFAWARQTLGADNLAAHEAAEAAVEALQTGADTAGATAAATRAARGPTRLAALNVPARRRAYAEWYDWARIESGRAGEDLHGAAVAALRAMEDGLGAGGAADAARRTLGVYPRGLGGLHFSKSPLRVTILMFFCGAAPLLALLPKLGPFSVFALPLVLVPVVGAYWPWWHAMLFKLASRENLPGGTSFWYAFVPIYAYIAVWRQLRAIGAPAWLLLGMLLAVELMAYAGNFAPIFEIGVVLYLLASIITAAYAYIVQRAANGYLAAAHSGAGTAPITVGEVVAAAAGGLVFLAMIVLELYFALG
jgi:hypothetical protein